MHRKKAVQKIICKTFICKMESEITKYIIIKIEIFCTSIFYITNNASLYSTLHSVYVGKLNFKYFRLGLVPAKYNC